MLRKGEFVAQYVEPIEDEQIQPHSVDLTVEEVYSFTSSDRIDKEGYDSPSKLPIEPEDGMVTLNMGLSYLFKYGEKITIPEGHRGMVYPRSRLLRCGGTVSSAVWDSGYSGQGKGLIYAGHTLEVEVGSSIAQIEFVETEDLEETYDGPHQGET